MPKERLDLIPSDVLLTVSKSVYYYLPLSVVPKKGFDKLPCL
jgi:hypothetical protein